MTTTTIRRSQPARGLRFSGAGWLFLLLLGGVALLAVLSLAINLIVQAL